MYRQLAVYTYRMGWFMRFFGLLLMGLGLLGMFAGVGQATVASVIAVGNIGSGAVFAVLAALMFVSGAVFFVGGGLREELQKLRRGLAIVVAESTEKAQAKVKAHPAAQRGDAAAPRRRAVAGGDDRPEPTLVSAEAGRLGTPGPRAVR